MNSKLFRLLLTFLFFSSCSLLKESHKNDEKIVDRIPLNVFSKGSGFHANTDIYIDELLVTLLLDTGAPSSRIRKNTYTKKYKVIDQKHSRGVSGKGPMIQIIQPSVVKIGKQKITKPRMGLGKSEGILGLNLLKNFIFQYDLPAKSLNVLSSMPQDSYPLKMLKTGHINIKVKFGDQSVYGLFDTGSDATVMDTKFIREHPGLFTVIRSETGTDHHGHKIESKVFHCKSVTIAGLTLKNVEVASFEYPDFLRKKMEGSPVILGNNIFKHGKWSFDINNKLWSLQPYP